MTVQLKDIVEMLDMPVDEYRAFVDLATGEVVSVSLELLRIAEESEEDEEAPDLPQWQLAEWDTAQQIASTDWFRELPTKFDVHDWAIMEQFAFSVESSRKRQELLTALHGSGAFRRFRNTLRREGLEQAWYAYKEQALRKIAIEWCEENGLAWK